MHEIRATVAPEHSAEAVRLAREAGIERITVTDVYVHGPNTHRQVVSVETATPRASAFAQALLNSPVLRGKDFSLTSRELRAIVDGSDVVALTSPMEEPFPEITQDLWQLSHITTSYVARAGAGAVLLALGIIDDNPVAIVVAALFLPFLAQVLAIGFGAWSRDRRLIRHGLRAVFVSMALAFIAGAIVGAVVRRPIQFKGFQGFLASFAISALIGFDCRPVDCR